MKRRVFSRRRVLLGTTGLTCAALAASIVFGSLAIGRAPTPTCLGEPATIVKGGGDNEITGTSGADVIVAGGGNDRVFAQAGDDTVCGGEGIDLIAGEENNDTLEGGSGRDAVVGGPGDDVSRGGKGNDGGVTRIALVAGVNGDGGEDRILGGDGKDTLSSNDIDEADDLDGGPKRDTCYMSDEDTETRCEIFPP